MIHTQSLSTYIQAIMPCFIPCTFTQKKAFHLKQPLHCTLTLSMSLQKNWHLWMSATITPEITHKLFLLFLMQRILPFPALHQQLYIIPIVKLLIPMIFIQIHLTIRQIEAIWKYTFQTSLQHGLLIWNHVPIPWRITI